MAQSQTKETALGAALRAAEIGAESTLARLRIYAALVMTIPHVVRFLSLGPDHHGGIRIQSLLLLAMLLFSGVTTLVLIARNRYGVWAQYLLAVFDAAMVAAICYLSLQFSGLSGVWVFATPTAWTIPVLLATGAMRYHPGIQLTSTLLFIVALVAVILLSPEAPADSLATATAEPEHLAGIAPTVTRLLLILAIGGATVSIMRRSRSLLMRVESEALSKAALVRFLPAEIVPLVTSGDEQAKGRRQTVAILFADMRDSTRMAERLDPFAVSEIIASFRTVVQEAARRNGGMIDKFIGDGALVLFGVPETNGADAAHGLQCGLDIVRMIAELQETRPEAERYSVGVGIHYGEVFCGVIGNEDRREFTVIGDPVNVAARIEAATRPANVCLLASGDVVKAAKAEDSWRVFSREQLRGRDMHTTLMVPKPENDV